MPRIPFSLLPPSVAVALAKRLLALGAPIAKLSPGLKVELIQANYDLTAKEYAALTVVVALTNVLVLAAGIALLGYLAGINVYVFAAAAALAVGAASFFSTLFYPRVIATRRVRALDDNLIPALRQILIELKSGVTLFQAMMSITEGYGEVSAEFKRIVEHINMGIAETMALNEASKRNPSPRFRRVLWQVSNAITSGSDVVVELEATIEDLTKERVDDIKRYGQELNPWTMVYMMGTGILPSLGVSVSVIILSFLNIAIPKLIFPAIIAGIILFQLFFINFVSSRRPSVD
ncbi:MAG: type II secretion system F family protein [Candidatus Micrarchaeia archaeon]